MLSASSHEKLKGIADQRRVSVWQRLGVCRTWGIESEKVDERGQILTISPAHSGTMVQESGEIWTA